MLTVLTVLTVEEKKSTWRCGQQEFDIRNSAIETELFRRECITPEPTSFKAELK